MALSSLPLCTPIFSSLRVHLHWVLLLLFHALLAGVCPAQRVLQVFEGSFRGRVLFENPEFVTPNAVRAYERRASAGGYDARKRAERRREAHRASLASEPDPMAERAVFAAPGAARDADTSGLSGDEDEDEEEDDIVGDPDR